MKTTLFSLAAGVFLVSSVLAAGVIPPATGWKSSLTFPTPPSGTDWGITKASQAQVKISTNTVTFSIKLNGVVDNSTAGTPVTQTGNTIQFDVRYHGVVKTIQFNADLSGGKTAGTIKNPVPLNLFPTPGLVAGDSLEIVRVRCIQGGSEIGAGQNFCVAGVTVK